MTLDILALIVLLLGLVGYLAGDRSKWPGLIAFAVGLLVLVAHAGWVHRV
ncbi:MAG: hypothetical protein QOI20_3298 [Acidimicrobiaceae bacterium]|nr:hypothetical protein [Acidimicrobiaceae bacterium]